jgi:hypothetical protein
MSRKHKYIQENERKTSPYHCYEEEEKRKKHPRNPPTRKTAKKEIQAYKLKLRQLS